MKFTEVNYDKTFYKKTKVKRFLDEFVNAKIKVAEVDWKGEYKTPTSCSASLAACARRNNMAVEVHGTVGKVYIVNKLILDTTNKKDANNG